MKRFKIRYHRNAILFGIGGEIYRCCDDDGSNREELVHIKASFLFWSVNYHFVLRKLP